MGIAPFQIFYLSNLIFVTGFVGFLFRPYSDVFEICLIKYLMRSVFYFFKPVTAGFDRV